MLDTISTGLDQPAILPDGRSAIESTVSGVDDFAARGQKGLQGVLDFLTGMERVSQFAGVTMAVAFYQSLQKWDQLSGQTFENNLDRQDHFEQTMFEKLGKSHNTIKRYLMAGRLLTGVEARIGRLQNGEREAVLKGLPARPVIDLIAVAQFESEHGGLTPKQLVQVSAAEDRSTVRRLLRGFRGEEEPEAQLRFEVDSVGTLYAVQGAQREPIGFIRRDANTDFLRQSLERFLRRSNIQEA